MIASLFSALHLLGLGIGLGAVFSRGLALRAVAAGEQRAFRRVLYADSFWGVAAVVWIATGLTRLIGGLDKTTAFYMHNGFFMVKMLLFVLVVVLEVAPMLRFIRWRMEIRKGGSPDVRGLGLLTRINDLQVVLIVVITFVAAAMTRGLWLVP